MYGKPITLAVLTLAVAAASPSLAAFEGENAYGPGVHRDIYGRAYQYRTFDGRVVREHIDVRPGGADMGTDQYGRPVRTYDLEGQPLQGVPQLPDTHAPAVRRKPSLSPP
jgi:hypothetical protein